MKKISFLLFLFLIFSKTIFANHLISQSSPYLQQHAHNPVNWYPWSKEAFEIAKKENKLIFLSIGYSTCHWCHVMEKESFENKEIAKLLNRDYIAIKVDKEEHLDIDKYYQLIHQIITQRGGGWPLTIILTPNKKPIFAATYIPAKDRYGMKGLETILPYLAKEYKKYPKKLEKIGDEIITIAKKSQNQRFLAQKVDKSIIKKSINELYTRFDKKYGGFGDGVKFPREATLLLLIDIYKLTQNKKALLMLTKTLNAMAKGGIYDQIEGGFFRYSTRRDFLIPHFEKMLYTNGLLIEVYTKAYFLTKNPLYKKIVLETIKEIDKRFKSNKLYFSASDADSSGVEGGYFVYRYNEALKALIKEGFSKKEAKAELINLGFREDGNFEEELNNASLKAKVSPKTILALKKLRQKREYPFIDYKKLTAWNAMYINAKLLASSIEPSFKAEALASLDTLLNLLYKNGLYHQLIKEKVTQKGFLEDYAYLIRALITAYEVSLDTKYLKVADNLYKEAKNKFFIKNSWYFNENEPKIKASIEDSSYPSALGVMFSNGLKLATLKEDLKFYMEVKKELKNFSAFIARNPSFYPTLTNAYLEMLYKDILIQSKKENLASLSPTILTLPYPYTLLLVTTSNSFNLCTIERCFAKVKNQKELFKAIKKYKKELQ